MFLLLTSVLLIGLTACGNKEPEYSLEFIEGKTVTIEDNEYVGAFFNFTNNGDATTYCPDDNYFYMRADFVHYMIYLSSWKVHALR